MRIAVAQIDSLVGDFEYNLRNILSCIDRAHRQDIDLLVFPELALCGYPPEDLLFKRSFIDANQRYLHKVRQHLKKRLFVVLGYVAREGNNIFNAAAVLSQKRIFDAYYKIILPNYGVFDERRYFTQGQFFSVYLFEDKKIALTICEDVWNDRLFEAFDGHVSPEILINISASPFFAGKFKSREKILSARAKALRATVVYCNLIGGQDELVFDGTSLVINPQGKTILCGKRFKEDFFIFDSTRNYPARKISINKTEEMYNALILGIRDYVKKNGFRKVVVGVSGGIDSAVTLSLAKDALGSDNVVSIIMPSQYTSTGTLSDAVMVSQQLGVRFHVIPITSVYSSYLDRLDPYIENSKSYDIACQNIQARIRGNILMSFSNRFGYLVLNTGNKSEISVGYCTLYGDMVGGFGVLKDVYKSNVYKIASYINTRSSQCVIPRSTIRRPPSAELRHKQKDEDDIPAYSVLDKVLRLYIEENMGRDAIIKQGFSRKLVNRVIDMVDRNEYKRRQAPPGIKITPKAFGKDRRMPITNKFTP